MTKTQQTALMIGALAVGGALISRGLRAARRIDFNGRSVAITSGSRGLGLLAEPLRVGPVHAHASQ